MTVAADTYLPAVWSLDTSTVQGIESSATDPKVRLDSTGLFTTDEDGDKVIQVQATPTGGTRGGIDLTGAQTGDPFNNARVRWVRPAAPASNPGAVIAELFGSSDGGGFGQGQLWALARLANNPATLANRMIIDCLGQSGFISNTGVNKDTLHAFAAFIAGNGGNSYTLGRSHGVTSVAGSPVDAGSGAGVGVCRVTLSGSAPNSAQDVWPVPVIHDNSAAKGSVSLVQNTPTIIFDVYQWSAANVATNRSFILLGLFRG